MNKIFDKLTKFYSSIPWGFILWCFLASYLVNDYKDIDTFLFNGFLMMLFGAFAYGFLAMWLKKDSISSKQTRSAYLENQAHIYRIENFFKQGKYEEAEKEHKKWVNSSLR